MFLSIFSVLQSCFQHSVFALFILYFPLLGRTGTGQAGLPNAGHQHRATGGGSRSSWLETPGPRQLQRGEHVTRSDKGGVNYVLV